jgi:glycosyltransferase involved in cell wall biosynthesis
LNRRALLKDALLLKLAGAFGVPTVVFFHGTGLPEFRARLSARWQRLLDSTLREAAGAIVLADCLRFNFEPFLPAERIFTLHPGVEPLPAAPPVTKAAGPFTILYLSALYPPKGLLDILAALPLVRTECPNVRLVLAGEWIDSQGRAEAENLIQTHQLQPVIEFTGAVTGARKTTLFQSADVFVFPVHSATEAFGLVLLEAMQVGLPIVATRGGARGEVIEEEVHGLLCAERNPRDLADKLLQLARDPALRARLGETNRARYAAHFTHEHFGRRLGDILAWVLESKCR